MTRKTLVLLLALVLLVGFAAAAFIYQQQRTTDQQATAGLVDSSALVRFHSPVMGPVRAPVTIVEFFDPSCEACRAFYPYVKQLLDENPGEVRLVIRYTLFHPASEETARLLEAARQQRLYQPVMEAILINQPAWHDDPKAAKAWEVAAAVGLDVEKARAEMHSAGISDLLKADMQDVEALGISGTPTFFVNGQPLTQFGPGPLRALVNQEVQRARSGQ